jgi:O-antigen/teichoic acid export membrane protein
MSGHAVPTGPRYLNGGRRAVLTLTDQIVSSASNFVVGVLIARAGGADALGAFGIAFLVWLVVLGANRALVTEPMTVGGAMDSDNAELREGLLATLILGVGGAGLLAVAGSVMGLAGFNPVAALALAPWIPSLLVQDYCRSMAFRLRCPGRALISDVVFAVVQGTATLGLFVFHVGSVSAFLASWGIGATAGAIVGLGQAHIRVTGRGGIPHLHALWPRSRWFLAEFGTAFSASQGYLLVLPVLLGTAAFGVYRAGASLIGPVVVIFIAGGNVGLAESVRRLRLDGIPGLAAYTLRLTATVVALTALYCGIVAIWAVPILRLTYGDNFTDAAVITRLVAADYLITAVGFGCGVALKAAGQMRHLWAMRAASAAVSITGVIVLANLFGLTGAGLAAVATGAAFTVGITVAYQRLRRGILAAASGTAAMCSEEGNTSVTP